MPVNGPEIMGPVTVMCDLSCVTAQNTPPLAHFLLETWLIGYLGAF